ncbi:MAG: S-methyl-5-thioribose-1-phosphate isomerase [Candidatus Thorarchaeota archaeon]
MIENKYRDLRAVWLEFEDTGNQAPVKMIDQTKIPFKVEIVTCPTYRETAEAIRSMVIRGAPSIGGAGAFGLAQAVAEFWGSPGFEDKLKAAYQLLLASRPTAVDLKHGLDFVLNTPNILTPERAINRAQQFADTVVEEGRKLGTIGATLIKSGSRILTHCHTGALALIDYGSALAPIVWAWTNEGKRFHVFVDETRPRLQGRITSWELSQYNIPHTVICDSMAASLMARGNQIDLIIVGADRVARNGDVANKIGTYALAIAAHYHNIPMYVAFPRSTYDPLTRSGKDIEIEKRSSREIRTVKGLSVELGVMHQISIHPGENNSRKFLNPAFDVTPNELISGYITPEGILTSKELQLKMA